MLALLGGKPLRDVQSRPWPSWPVWGEEEKERLVRTLESGIWSYNGPMEQECLAWLKGYLSSGMPLLAANGTLALQLALEALDVGYGDEVIVPALTWQATAAAVLDVNAVPVLVDVDPDTWCLDPACFEEAVTQKTRAVIPVHLYGCTADMDAVCSIARKHHIAVVEDAAHKFGAQWRGKHLGSIGDIGSFSLQLSKVVTCGEGGILLTNQQDLWERLEALRNCGRRSSNMTADASGGQYGLEGDFIQSGNYRITEFQAAVLIEQLKRADEQNDLRLKRARYLDSLLSICPGIRPMPFDERETKKAYFNYTFSYDEKDFGLPPEVFRRALGAELGIEVDSCYQPLNDCTLYRPLTKRRYQISSEYRQAIDPSRFTLPVSQELYTSRAVTFHHKVLLGSEEDIEQIAEAVNKIADNRDSLKALR